MMDNNGFNQLVDEIMSQGYDEETAARYAALIGDTPVSDGTGHILVMEDGQQLARLKSLKCFGAQ